MSPHLAKPASLQSSALERRLRDGVTVSKREHFFIDDRWEPVGVSDQFMENAEVYHQLRTIDFSGPMEQCLRLAGVDRNATLHILDIGSGSGGSVFAAAQLIPDARIVASDISPQLLNMLGSAVEKEAGLRSRVTAYCFDLHQPFFEQNQFDLVIGWAILHHLADPLAALQNVVYALKPGGSLLLNEPFEAGNMLLYAMYEKIIKYLTDAGDADGTLAKIMRAMRFDFQHRLGVPALKPWTLMLDDKWLFDEPYLQQLGSELAFDSVKTYAGVDDLGHLYEGTFRSLMHDTGNANLKVPDGVWDIIHQFDRGICVELKARLAPGGYIIFAKGASTVVAARGLEEPAAPASPPPNVEPVEAPQTATWKRNDDAFGTEPHWRSEYALALPNAELRAASGIADLGMFLAIGEAWAQVAARFMPVEDPVVVDIGAGCGKMGRFLLIDPGLRYIGMDVLEPAMRWCTTEFSRVYGDRARFVHLDVYSSLYNPQGRMKAETLTLPFGSQSADFVICGSLFTHLLEPEMLRYLAEIARILKPGGRLMASIHIDPPEGKRFSGDAVRIDMDPQLFIESNAGAGLGLRQHLGNIYGQETYLFERLHGQSGSRWINCKSLPGRAYRNIAEALAVAKSRWISYPLSFMHAVTL